MGTAPASISEGCWLMPFLRHRCATRVVTRHAPSPTVCRRLTAAVSMVQATPTPHAL